jgi:putative DNA primase/helicase
MGTVVYIAKQHGYQPARDLYQRASLEEEAGIIYPGLRYRLTQAGNGERFADKYRATVRYCPERNAWYIWDGRRLAIDQTAQITRMALQTFRDIIREAAEIESPKARESVLKWAKTSESKACIEASLSLAHPGTELAVSAEALDAKPMCINLQNGIFDLETMTLCAHDIEELHTRIIPIDYVEDAECPKWLAFLDRIFAGDEELIDFLQRAVGYTLSALTTEECLFFCYGSGANGKSIFFSVIDMLLGGTEGYAHKAKNDLVMLRKGDPGVPMDIAELKGKRFVYCDELPENRRFDESKIKDITSHDKLKGRYIFERPIEFMPTHKLWMYGNHRPIITGQDDGIWRRIHMVPFTVTIPEGERRPPEVLKSEFQAEAPGILRWALEGFYHWRHNGRLSRLPKCVRDATAEYQTEMDTIGSFIGEEVLETPGSRLPHKVLYNRYKQWCVENGVTHIMTSKKLSRHLRETKRWPSQLDRKESHEWINRQLNDHEQTTIF